MVKCQATRDFSMNVVVLAVRHSNMQSWKYVHSVAQTKHARPHKPTHTRHVTRAILLQSVILQTNKFLKPAHVFQMFCKNGAMVCCHGLDFPLSKKSGPKLVIVVNTSLCTLQARKRAGRKHTLMTFDLRCDARQTRANCRKEHSSSCSTEPAVSSTVRHRRTTL